MSSSHPHSLVPPGFQEFGPESFSTLQRSVKDDVAHPSLGLVVQLLRLSRLDPDVFIKFRATLVDQVSYFMGVFLVDERCASTCVVNSLP